MDDFKITPIRNGTAIDHIAVGQAINVLKILNVNENTISSAVSIAMHVWSKKANGWKDIIKIEDRELDRRTIDKIGLIAPDATISIIRDYAVAPGEYPKVYFYADHPFAFVIGEATSGAILFEGIYTGK